MWVRFHCLNLCNLPNVTASDIPRDPRTCPVTCLEVAVFQNITVFVPAPGRPNSRWQFEGTSLDCIIDYLKEIIIFGKIHLKNVITFWVCFWFAHLLALKLTTCKFWYVYIFLAFILFWNACWPDITVKVDWAVKSQLPSACLFSDLRRFHWVLPRAHGESESGRKAPLSEAQSQAGRGPDGQRRQDTPGVTLTSALRSRHEGRCLTSVKAVKRVS